MPDISATRTGRLMAEVRAMPLFRQLVPMEAAVGWPIPVRRGAGTGRFAVYLRLPLYGFRPVGGQDTELFPPFATLTLDWRSGQPVEYADLRFTRPWPVPERPVPVGAFPHAAVRTSYGEYTADRERLLAGYDEMAGALGEGRAFTGAEGFSALLRKLMEPGLEPYYRALAPRFLARFLGPGPSAADPADPAGGSAGSGE